MDSIQFAPEGFLYSISGGGFRMGIKRYTYALKAQVWQTRDGAYGISRTLGQSARIGETSNKSSLQGLCAEEESSIDRSLATQEPLSETLATNGRQTARALAEDDDHRYIHKNKTENFKTLKKEHTDKIERKKESI